MKDFFLRHRTLHLWLLADIAVLAAYFAARGNRAWMNALTEEITGPLRQAIGRLCYRTEVSVMEVLAALLVLACAGYLIGSIAAVVRAKGRRGDRAYRAALGALCAGLAELCRADPAVRPEAVHVAVAAFNASSIDIDVRLYCTALGLAEFREMKTRLNLQIMGLMEREGCGFAFPSTSVCLEKTPQEAGHAEHPAR